ncbi:polysaccharide deacetylase family protein [Chelatococcus reniformis]|uniref:Chitooligosaccharide deacetylase n=1 Tax=Chelatococcus reniformis TaxID=1494448 RepID=A0A916U6J9_9HYPH|nr:polysaccharide deacetylase family protein [Chelatococcus reniformis]GGC62491.1 hypothetical protein GCM10010994_21330 [Chelatococcus reniformis]
MKRLTLTFDNGPEPPFTHHVLDVLAAHGIKATFFAIGSNLRLKPDAHAALRRAKSEGHRIGNHTYYHAYSFGDVDRDDAVEFEVAPTFAQLGELADPALLVRPYCYGGVLDSRVFKPADVEAFLTGGYTCVLYNSVPRDWEGGDWDQRALADMAGRAWTTMVLHDIAMNPGGVAEQPIAKLDSFIRQAKAAGYEFTQEYSPDAVLMAGGKILQPIDHLVTGRTAGSGAERRVSNPLFNRRS